MHAALIAAVLFAVSGAAPLPYIEQEAELVSIAHLPHGNALVFVWDSVVGEWTCLDYRWACNDMGVSRQGDHWLLSWHDDGDGCYRVIRTRRWVESWESNNPLDEHNGRPWFAQLLMPGLRQVRKPAGGSQ